MSGTISPPFLQPSPVYNALADHQRHERSWTFRDVIDELHTWSNRFNLEFKLELPALALAIDRTRRRNCLGHYRPGHNGFGLRCEIFVAESHVLEALETNTWYEVLGTLLHEQLHGWQEFYGRSGRRNYHNKQFRRKAAELGLIVDERGHTEYDPGSPFFDLLERHGIEVPALPTPVLYTPRPAKVKLHLWTCGCTKVRIGRSHFNARCLDCGCRFEQVN